MNSEFTVASNWPFGMALVSCFLWEQLDVDAYLLCCIGDLACPVIVCDLAMEAAHVADDILRVRVECDFNLSAAGGKHWGIDDSAGNGEPVFGFEVGFDHCYQLASAEMHVRGCAVVGFVVCNQRHGFESAAVHSPWGGAMSEQHAAIVRERRVAEVCWTSGDVVHQYACWNVHKIGLAVSHVSVIVCEGECEAWHDAGVTAHATVRGDRTCVVLDHQIMEDVLQEERFSDGLFRDF